MEPQTTHPLGPAAACHWAAAFGVLVMLVASCGGKAGRGEVGGGGWTESGRPPGAPAETLGASVRLDAGSYAIGEPIKMMLSAVNLSGRALVLEFPTSQRFDFVVSAGGKPIWRWSDDMMFAQILGSETLAPGDSLVYEFQWNQVLADGTNPGLGAYTVRGVIKTRPEVASPDKRFGVVD